MLSGGESSVLQFLPFTASFPLVPDFLEAIAAEFFILPPDFGEAFSVDISVVFFDFGPGLAATSEDCLEGAEEAFAGLALDLVEAPAAEVGFVIFFLGASLAAFSAAEVFNPSLLSSFLGEAGFFMEDPGLETWFSVGHITGVLLPFVSPLGAAAAVAIFSVPPSLTFPPSFTLDLLVGLLVFVVSDF